MTARLPLANTPPPRHRSRVDTAPQNPDLPPQKKQRKIPLRAILGILASIAVFGAIIFAIIGTPATGVTRSVDGTNLRAIGQVMIACAIETDGTLPSADFAAVPMGNADIGRRKDVYEVAAILDRAGFKNHPSFWVAEDDSNFPPPPNDQLTTVIDPAQEGLTSNARINPKFHGAALAVAVAIFPPGTKLDNLPATTPLAWTRGLQLDGRWSKTLGTYGDWGGFIVFADGNLEKYKPSINGRLVKFGTNQPTSNILEALPPGSRVSQFTPPKK